MCCLSYKHNLDCSSTLCPSCWMVLTELRPNTFILMQLCYRNHLLAQASYSAPIPPPAQVRELCTLFQIVPASLPPLTAAHSVPLLPFPLLFPPTVQAVFTPQPSSGTALPQRLSPPLFPHGTVSSLPPVAPVAIQVSILLSLFPEY